MYIEGLRRVGQSRVSGMVTNRKYILKYSRKIKSENVKCFYMLKANIFKSSNLTKPIPVLFDFGRHYQ